MTALEQKLYTIKILLSAQQKETDSLKSTVKQMKIDYPKQLRRRFLIGYTLGFIIGFAIAVIF
ncbi:MAG: hypothetical protein JU82_05190 [Sulfuricurvum sp. MLSB]|jgi:hypothetical protein|uniref:hypothetical protein n=1 Tax=Sulfuricurvum sp. MLSB TaxID=1537917 RepID=UPI0005043106|nr:hypothetical protein [Sulfuricurvum sp. MLSB]KFN39982.1 MAG: hypothetical protein JU82_05190 [Sulfuricurvum sp. MLSB]